MAEKDPFLFKGKTGHVGAAKKRTETNNNGKNRGGSYHAKEGGRKRTVAGAFETRRKLVAVRRGRCRPSRSAL